RDRAQLAQHRRLLRAADQIDPDALAAWLVEHGFRRTEAVELPGEFSRRGGIVDVFSPDAEAPYRLEFFGDEIESIRQFSPQTQRSLGNLEAVAVTGAGIEHSKPTENRDGSMALLTYKGHLVEYLSGDAWTLLVEPDDLQEQGKHY